MRLVPALVVALSILVLPLGADVLDPESESHPVLGKLAELLDAVGVDVLNSHASDAGKAGPSFGDPPRIAPLLGFKGWAGAEIDLDRYGKWLESFETGARGAVAAAPTEAEDKRPDLDEFKRIWKDAEDGTRIVITFDAADGEAAEKIAGVLEANGYAVYLAVADPDREPIDPELLGKLFVKADHCLVIETASARLNAIIQFEADLLAALQRQRAWVAEGGEGLPPTKRGSMDVLEALGVLPMQAVPGGIVLGTPPRLDRALAGAVFTADGGDYGIEIDGRVLALEQVSPETVAAIGAFVSGADSHSVVDISGNDVTLTPAFRNTRIGERMARADHRPFKRLSIDGAQKSLIVDHEIRFRRAGERLAADVTMEVRFYRHAGGAADRLATIRFTLQDAAGSPRLLDLAWSRAPEHRIGFDGKGVGALAGDLEACAVDAALISIARLKPPSEG